MKLHFQEYLIYLAASFLRCFVKYCFVRKSRHIPKGKEHIRNQSCEKSILNLFKCAKVFLCTFLDNENTPLLARIREH